MNLNLQYLMLLPTIFSLFCYDTHSTKLSNAANDSNINLLANLFSKLIFWFGETDFRYGMAFAVISPVRYDHTMIEIFEKAIPVIAGKWPIVINDGFFSDKIGEFAVSYRVYLKPIYFPDLYIIPVYKNLSLSFIETQIMVMERKISFNHRSIILIVIVVDHCGNLIYTRKNLEQLFQKMWLKNLFDTRLLYLSKCDGFATVVTGRPYYSENACGMVGKGGLTFTHFALDEQFSTKNISFYQEKGKTLTNCRFQVGTSPFPPYVLGKKVTENNRTHFEFFGGMDIEFLRLFSSKYNIIFDYFKPERYDSYPWFTTLANGSVRGILQGVLNHDIDVACGGMVPSYASYSRYDNSLTYKFSSIRLYVRDTDTTPQWKIYFKAFPFEVWMSLIVTFLSVYLLFYLMNNLDISYSKLFYGSTFQILSLVEMYISGLVAENLNPKPLYLRVLLISWALYTMQWYIAYQSLLFTLLTNPPHEQPINTFEDLNNSGIKVSMNPLYMEYFGHLDQDSITQSILDNHIECKSTEFCINQLLDYGNISLMEKEETVELVLNLKRSKAVRLVDKMVTYGVSFITDHGSILIQELNNVLLACFEAGLFTKWEKDVGIYYINETKQRNQEEGIVPLSIEDLKGSFAVLVCGLGFSIVVFIGEILVFHIKKFY